MKPKIHPGPGVLALGAALVFGAVASAGAATYQRPVSSGHGCRVWTPPVLAIWTEDTGFTRMATPAGTNELVEIILSIPRPTTEPRLFVSIQAG